MLSPICFTECWFCVKFLETGVDFSGLEPLNTTIVSINSIPGWSFSFANVLEFTLVAIYNVNRIT